MNSLRCCLAIVAGGAFGILVAELILGLGPRDAGPLIAVMAACYLARCLIKAIQEDRDEQRLGREAVRLRRDRQHTPERNRL